MNPRHLFGICVLFVALLIAGAAFVLAVGAEAVLSANTAQETLRIAPNSSGMSEEEFMAYAGRMEQKYGPEAVSALRLHIPDETRGPSQGAGATPNIRYVSAWSGSLEIGNNDGVVLADSDNALVLYALDSCLASSISLESTSRMSGKSISEMTTEIWDDFWR